MINKINELKKTIEQQEAIINFQAAQHDLMVDLRINQEKIINNLRCQVSELQEKPKIELEPRTTMIKLAD